MATEDAFKQFVSWCDRTTSCKLHNQNVGAVWDDLLARADRGEMGTLTSQQIIERTFGALYGPMWHDLASYIATLQPEAPLAKQAVTAENPFQAVFCEDWNIRPPNFTELNRLMEIERRVSPRMRGSQIGHTAITTCLGWPSDVNNPQHRLSVTKAPKILLLQGLHDPAASHMWGVNVQTQMSSNTSSLLTYEGNGFGVYTRSTCTRGKTDGYLLNLVVPAHGTRCAAVDPS
nr:hypothetical protein [uncultured bacterium]